MSWPSFLLGFAVGCFTGVFGILVLMLRSMFRSPKPGVDYREH